MPSSNSEARKRRESQQNPDVGPGTRHRSLRDDLTEAFTGRDPVVLIGESMVAAADARVKAAAETNPIRKVRWNGLAIAYERLADGVAKVLATGSFEGILEVRDQPTASVEAVEAVEGFDVKDAT